MLPGRKKCELIIPQSKALIDLGVTCRVVGLLEAIEVEVHHCRWLAAAIRKSNSIIVGILVATLVNHAAAGAVGGWVAQALEPAIFR